MSTQTNLFKTPIASGRLNGVNWASLTTKEEIRTPQIEALHKDAMKYKALFRSDFVSHADVIKILHNCTVYEFIQKPINRLAYYKSKAKYKNNKKVLL